MMDLVDRIREFASIIPKQLEFIKTEESTKTALVMPFIGLLGYNVFDPTEVIPEHVADFGKKIACKCDYAIYKDGKPIILFECKWSGRQLERKDQDQLKGYFAACEDVKYAVVTNGLDYHFFSDTKKSHVMDETPFFRFNLLDMKPQQIETLKIFTKDKIGPGTGDTVQELKYIKDITDLVHAEFKTPSPDFVRHFASQVYQGRLTTQVAERFTKLTTIALYSYVNERLSATLASALNESQKTPIVVEPEGIKPQEQEAFMIIKAILCNVAPPERIFIKDLKAGCSILLDNNKRKCICALNFDAPPKKVIRIGKDAAWYPFENMNDIYRMGDTLREVVTALIKGTACDTDIISEANGE
jgi:predicted type IV restriction endonuclease